MLRRENLWVSGAFRTGPEGQQQAKTMLNNVVGCVRHNAADGSSHAGNCC
jgi:hypothetical protein